MIDYKRYKTTDHTKILLYSIISVISLVLLLRLWNGFAPFLRGNNGWINLKKGQGNPSAKELQQCTEEIWEADTNSFPEDEIKYNLDGPKLFTYVKEDRLSTGVYPYLLDLLEKFSPVLGTQDASLDAEIAHFLDAVLETPVMKVAYTWVHHWGFADSPAEFRSLLTQYWFLKYSRSHTGVEDSSGFEHVFQGEIWQDSRQTVGFHGWVQMYRTEQNGEMEFGTSQADHGNGLIKLKQFHFRGAEKPISSIWIGKSVELEFALYSVCFIARMGQNCNISVNGGTKETIISVRERGVSPATIGTVYPKG